MSTIQEIPLKTITGEDATLAEHTGKVLLIVNVASQCGLTPQYEQLEKIYEERRDKGFEVLGFPANNFGAQEPGTDEEIAEFCRTNYSVKFPMYSKISVVGDDQHPLYRELTFRGRLDRVEGRKIFTSGTLHAGEMLCAEAEGLFVSVPRERLTRLAEEP